MIWALFNDDILNFGLCRGV